MTIAEAATFEGTGNVLIRGKMVPVTFREIEQTRLRFFSDNPRIYTIIHADGENPTQGDIEAKLIEMEHVRDLMQDIKLNGGLIDPVIVKDKSFEVLEGNSRLAAYRALAKKEPLKWARMRCTILPADIDDKLVFALLGQYHVKGKKNWAPYEQAGFLYRRFKQHHIDKDELAIEIGLSKVTVEHLIETYQFMVDHKDDHVDRWSYYDEYLKSKKIKAARKTYANFDDLIVEKIQSGEIERAVDVRDRLPSLCATPKVLKKFVAGQSSFPDACEDVDESGGNDEAYRRLARFQKWLSNPDAQDAIVKSRGEARNKIQFELKKVQVAVKGLLQRL